MRFLIEHDVGPPKATPKLEAWAKQNVDWLDDKPSLRPVPTKRKSYHPPYRERLTVGLAAEFRKLVVLIETVGPTCSQPDVGADSRRTADLHSGGHFALAGYRGGNRCQSPSLRALRKASKSYRHLGAAAR